MQPHTVLSVDRDTHYVLVDTGMLIQLSEGLGKQIEHYEAHTKEVLKYQADGLTYNQVSRLHDPRAVDTEPGKKPFDAQEDLEFLTIEISRMTALRDQMRKAYS
jgi:hypothetical protein